MTYPKTILTRPIRRGIMFFLIISFFVISPLIILYTAGYRYDFNKHEIKQTGVISIDVKPREVNVYLNGVQIQKRIPIRLTNRAPGAYHLKIESPGYKTWEKDVTVESKQTSYIRQVTLFKDSSPTELLKENMENVVDLKISADGLYVLILEQKDAIYEINLFNIQEKKLTPVVRTHSDSIPKLYWSEFYPTALIETKNNNLTQIQLFYADSPETEIKTQTFRTNEEIKYQWNPNTKDPLVFVQVNSAIYKMTKNNINLLQDNVSVPVWYVDQKETAWIFDQKTQSIQEKNKEEPIAYVVDQKIEKIININEKRLLLKTNQGILIITTDNKDKPEQQFIKADFVQYSPEREEWIAWSPWELWSIYNNGNISLLNRTSEEIRFVQPLDKYGLLLLASENKITGFNPGYYITHELFTVNKIKTISANISNRKIYFWGEINNTNGLFELDY